MSKASMSRIGLELEDIFFLQSKEDTEKLQT